ncbi:MAG TPA: DJ-1/PfpI family protein [Candidatus Dormibacteraeota bacterium]|nr:DJ-1/PfpI family protein [Candidatus Dormibacteraeota bacterium]
MKIDIVAFDGMDELDAVGPLEVLRRADFDVELVSFQPDVTCAYGLTITPDGTPRSDADLVIFPGGGWVNRASRGVRAEVDGRRWIPLIEDAKARGAILASVCTGAMILAGAGVLRGRRATTHHGAWADLEGAGAKLVRERVVDDGDVVTAGGVTSGIDLGLWLVERFAGRELAEGIASDLEYQAAGRAC